FKCGVVILFLIFPGGLLNCITFLRFISSPLVDSIFPFVVWLLIVRSYFWPFTRVQNGNQREVMRKVGFAALRRRRVEALNRRDPPSPGLLRARQRMPRVWLVLCRCQRGDDFFEARLPPCKGVSPES